jgi:hypothetical protein
LMCLNDFREFYYLSGLFYLFTVLTSLSASDLVFFRYMLGISLSLFCMSNRNYVMLAYYMQSHFFHSSTVYTFGSKYQKDDMDECNCSKLIFYNSKFIIPS